MNINVKPRIPAQKYFSSSKASRIDYGYGRSNVLFFEVNYIRINLLNSAPPYSGYFTIHGVRVNSFSTKTALNLLCAVQWKQRRRIKILTFENIPLEENDKLKPTSQ